MKSRELGKNVRQLRELKGLTQQNLSDAVNISQKTLSRIENGQVSPTFDLLEKICDELKIKINQLLDFNEQNIFNSYTLNQTGGEFKAYNNTNIEQIIDLYERLLKEKELKINELINKL